MSNRFHWDGTPKADEERGFAVGRTMWLHRSNHSTTLRRDAMAKCRYCGLPMMYFDRDNHQRIPMVPKPIPSALVPPQMRWHVSRGVAFHGDVGEATCWVPHPAFCPQLAHDDDVPASIVDVRARYRRRSEDLIASGKFIPDLVPPRCEEDVAEQHVQDVEDIRHVISYNSMLWLGAGRVEALQCVARAATTGERCPGLVSQGEGRWEEVEIPYMQGRAGQDVLWAGTTMWVYGLHALFPEEISRWMKQRCTYHASGYAADAVPAQWVPFSALRHDEHIMRERPAMADAERKRDVEERAARTPQRPKRTACAAEGCSNGSVAAVPAGWLCWTCDPVQARRERTHHKWQAPAEESPM
ncbi:DUF6083 domain-containing protein [Streptomyces sp. NBC_01571]|uniref:DUF6083 domain-containing protein n=1 Tax=Streptomyces sp. NBC_01571 TaxID=2975883 RepID=UPI002250FDAA|nr:DUF6083 domain-containing protein [Streptomyces sp. NBC_01571]MCX4581271.1 DUF6083 domain-containing protein [Streptomyces sp. NBC_01571]